MTLLCVPISGSTLDSAADAMRRAQAAGAEMLELRLDLLPADATAKLPPLAGVPVLATCRDQAESGQMPAGAAEPTPAGHASTDAARAAQLANAVHAGAAVVDFEFAAWQRSADARAIIRNAIAEAHTHGRSCRLILSAHDFTKRPAGLGQLARDMAVDADIVKVAYRAERISDCFDALDILRQCNRPAIALAMGEAGMITRLLARKLGAFLTFAALDAERGTAPGQPTLGQFTKLYRWTGVSPITKVFGVIGCPIAHSMSPAVHNAAFDAVGYDGLYVPMRVEPSAEDFAALLDGLRARPWLDIRGLSVTIPHKENALNWLRAHGGEIEPLAQRIGAVNTISLGPDGSLAGRNTDYAAARDAICDALGCDPAGLAGRSVAVLGAGGAARAIVAGLVDAGARVTIFNRTLARGQQLAADFDCRAEPLAESAESVAACQIVVNATSIGMHPNEDESPAPAGSLHAGQLVFDTVYNPMETRLLSEAQRAGAHTIDGVAMFVRQAAAQFQWWTGQPAPADVMREVVVARLARL